MEFRFRLEKYNGLKSRYKCPSCLTKRSFVRYVDYTTGEYLSDRVGRCNRVSRCYYHYTPYQYFNDNHITVERNLSVPYLSKLKEYDQEISYISEDIVNQSLQGYIRNNLYVFMANKIGVDETRLLFQSFSVGTSKRWDGATIFWQKDINGNYRTGKVMLYNPYTGKRVKEPFPHITWAHKLLKIENFSLKQCLWGEHKLATGASRYIGLVEAEKTALFASHYFPDITWIATGGMENLSQAKCKVLENRNVILYPDTDAEITWAKKVKCFPASTNYIISSALSNMNLLAGYDLADFLA